jgi:hypothetical protein
MFFAGLVCLGIVKIPRFRHCRGELLAHVIVLNERYPHRRLREYVAYYNAKRVHSRLRDAPHGRPVEPSLSQPHEGERRAGPRDARSQVKGPDVLRVPDRVAQAPSLQAGKSDRQTVDGLRDRRLLDRHAVAVRNAPAIAEQQLVHD